MWLLAPVVGRPLARAQGAASPAALFGVTIGERAGAPAIAGANCVAAADGSAVVCSPPPSRPPLAAVETLWLRDGRIEQAFLVVDLSLSSRTPFEVDFRRARDWVAATLGAPGQQTPIPDGWSAPAIDNRRRFEELVAGRARLEASWWWRANGTDARAAGAGEVGLRLWIATDGGQPRLVLGMRRESPTATTTPTTASAGATSAPGCEPAAVAEMLLDLFPPAPAAARKDSARRLAACHLNRAAGALGAALAHDPAPPVQEEALRALAQIDAAPADDDLVELAHRSPPLARISGEVIATRRRLAREAAERADEQAAAQARKTAAKQKANERTTAQAPAPPAGAAQSPTRLRVSPGAALPPPPKLDSTVASAAPAATAGATPSPRPSQNADENADEEETPPAAHGPAGEPSGVPLAIGASTAAGAVLMRNLGLMGLSGVSPQLLLGGAGAVIGFGTSWGLSRFGFRPTLGQAVFFTNTAAWGTLAGLLAWQASGSDSVKLQYGSLVLGEAVGMGIGVFGANRWKWTPGQVVLADGLLLGAALTSVGVDRLRDQNPPTSVAAAVATPIAMAAAAVVAHMLDPTRNDLRLMTLGAIGGAWTGGLIAAGAARTALFGSYQGQGGLLVGAGAGFLGAAAAGAFTEIPARSVSIGTAGILAGNLLGLGLNMALASGSRDSAGVPTSTSTLTDADRDRWKLGAGIGGTIVGAAALAYAPHLVFGPEALTMTLSGALYGGATWFAATQAGSDGTPRSPVETAHLEGGVLAGAVAGGLGGLLASRWFAPDAVDKVTAFGAAGAGAAVGLGIARLTTDGPGRSDTLGVLAGAGGGLAAGIWLDRTTRLRAPDFGAATVGTGYGALIGALVPTLRLDSWNDGRSTSGGTWLGIGAGAAAGAALSHLTGASGSEVAVPAVAGIFGLGIGYGVGLLWPAGESRPARIGAVAGPLALMGGAIAVERRLHLAEGLGDEAAPLALSGGLYGGAWGLLMAGTIDHSGLISSTPGRQLGGGALMGASAGVATGLVLSTVYDPDRGDIAFTFGGGAVGAALGFGVPLLAYDQRGRADTLGTLVGSSVGMLGAALLAPQVELAPPEIGAGFIGAGYGALAGTLLPTIFEPTWDGGRRAGGGALVGLGIGAITAGGTAHLKHASSGGVAAASGAGLLGLAMGFGAGMMLPTDSLQPARVGTVVGPLSALGLSAALEPRLHLSQGLGADAPGLGSLGAAFGIADGLMVAAALDPSGTLGQTPSRQRFGGALLGGAAELSAGLLLSKVTTLSGDTAAVWGGGKLFGGLLGAGTLMLAQPSSTGGRAETLATLGGSLAGLGAAVAVERVAPLEAPDSAAAAVGVGFGGVLGALAPSLGIPHWPGWTRETTGGLLVGVAGGAFGGAALRRATEASGSTVALTAAGGGDGLLTGLGAGLLLGNGDDSRATRVGMAAGTVAGLGIGMGVWPRLTLSAADRRFVLTGTLVGGWTALWIPALGHDLAQDFDGRRMTGGALAGAGVASFATSLLTPALELDEDLLVDATGVDVLFSGAGAGAGALASGRADAPVWGLLAGGTAGLLLGGALHDQIDLGADDAPLLTLAGFEGAWLGAWLPYLLTADDDAVTAGEHAGGLAAGVLGSLGLATLASGQLHSTSAEAGYTALGSGVGAAIAGGAALLNPDFGRRSRVGLTLAGTGAGLVGGALLGRHLELTGETPLGAGGIGATLGAAEALVFAWSGRETDAAQYAGSALVGAGLGTALGIAAGISSEGTSSNVPAAAGFAAWGAWMGSFAGSLVKTDAHEIVLGGLAGANVGLLGGYSLLRFGVVEPRDFGWLSLFGAMGTVAGAGAGAPFSTNAMLAGLAIGPAAGMLTGALILPRLRRFSGGRTPVHGSGSSSRRASLPAGRVASWSFVRRDGAPADAPTDVPTDLGDERVPDRRVISADIIDDGDAAGSSDSGFARSVKKVVEITEWTPMIGALPTAATGDPRAPTPMLLGVTGLWQ